MVCYGCMAILSKVNLFLTTFLLTYSVINLLAHFFITMLS